MSDQGQFFIKRLYSLAKFLKAEMDGEILAMYDRILSPVGYPALIQGLDRLATELGVGSQFPSMRAIKEAAMGVVAINSPAALAEDAEKSRVAAALIIQAVRRYGSVNDTRRVQEHVGELGWQLVLDRGGWQAVCDQMPSEDDVRNYELDLRELGKAKLSRRRKGEVGPPSLPPIGGHERAVSAILEGSPIVDLTPANGVRP